MSTDIPAAEVSPVSPAGALGRGWLNPWYASWGVSLSATEEDALGWVAVGLTAFLLLGAVPR
jgi:hypothetical protein